MNRIIYMLPYFVCIGGMWFVGLTHGYTEALNGFLPHGSARCTVVEILCIIVMAWALSRHNAREVTP